MLTRPLHSPTSLDGANPLNTSSTVQGPASYHDWLRSLRRQHMVRMRTHVGVTMPPGMVTDDTPCYVWVGKLKFHRRNGWQTARQSSCVYRMKLRLVRDERDPG
jgi:hypothetical protein